MNRRGFLQGLGVLVAGIAVEKAVPLGRVWSFPKTIRLPQIYYDSVFVENLAANTPYYTICNFRPLQQRSGRTLQLFGCSVLP